MIKFIATKLKRLFADRKFFVFVCIFFFIEALWVAFSAAYPQAFDENFHFGIIQIYAHHYLPFLRSQPPHANEYGAVTRDPSYLYHYLMSYPYRVISYFFHKRIDQVIVLRLLNIVLFGIAIILIRKIFLRAKISRSLTHVSLFLFILIPIVPQLAAQINYDNLLLPLTALEILIAFQVMDEIRAAKPSIKSLSFLLILGLETSLVKYAFLPIFAGIILYLCFLIFRLYGKHLRNFMSLLQESWRSLSIVVKVLLIICLLVSMGMFWQRDGYNLIHYHSIEPNCAKVLSVSACQAYSPWAYNFQDHAAVLAHGKSIHFTNPLAYLLEWFYWMWYRLFFAVNGPKSSFENYPPLPLPAAAAIIIGAVGLFSVLKWREQIFHQNSYMALLFVVSGCYVIALIGQGYYTYLYTDVLENMNGRYLIPILLFIGAIFAKGISLQFAHSDHRKYVLGGIVLIFFLQGGGVFTFITRSDETWDVNNHTVRSINDTARHITKPVLIRGKKTYSTSVWWFN